MTVTINDHDWVYGVVILGKTPGDDQLAGQTLPEEGVSFIPAFQTKEEALKCYNLLALDPEKKHEVQAILFEDLKARAAENGFMIFVLDGQGKVLDKIG
jgi:hypothetical protein